MTAGPAVVRPSAELAVLVLGAASTVLMAPVRGTARSEKTIQAH